MRRLLGVEAEFGVVEVDGCDGGVGLVALGYLGGLRVVNQDRQTAENDGLDFEEVVWVHPDCACLC